MLEVITWFWKPKAGFRSQFTVEHVNILRRMVARHYAAPHRFSVITDTAGPYDPDIRVIPLWDDYAGLLSLWGPDSPSCFRRLRAFTPEMSEVIGPRFVSLDLDVVICGDLTPVWNRTEDFIIWGEDNRRTPYNGSMWMMNAGARKQVWDRFVQKPAYILDRARAAGFFGSDQAVVSYVLGRNEPRWTSEHGVFSYRTHVRPNGGVLPKDARVVFFEGNYDPTHPVLQQKSPWIMEHYR